MPGTSNVGANIRELNGSATKRPFKQKVAIALAEARKAGGSIAPPPSAGKQRYRTPAMPKVPGMPRIPKI